MKKWKLIFVALFSVLLVGCSVKQEQSQNKKLTADTVELSKLSPTEIDKVKFELDARAFIPKNLKDAKKDVKATFDLIIRNKSGRKIKFDLSEFKINNSNLNPSMISTDTLIDDADSVYISLFSGIAWKKDNKLTYKGKEIPVTAALQNKEEINNWMEKNSGNIIE